MPTAIKRRSAGSLRLEALSRIARIGHSDDLDRLFATLGSPAPNLVLEPLVAENLIAYSEGVKNAAFASSGSAVFGPNVSYWLIQCWQYTVSCPMSFKTTNFALTNLNLSVSRNLATYFSVSNSKEVIDAYFTEFERVWRDVLPKNSTTFLPLFSSLLGVLQGISEAKNPKVIDENLVGRLLKFCESPFTEKAQKYVDEEEERSKSRSNPHNSSPELPELENSSEEGVMALIFASLRAVLLYIEDLSKLSDSSAIARFGPVWLDFAEKQLALLEDAFRYHLGTDSTVSPLVEPAMTVIFRGIELCIPHLSLPIAWSLVNSNFTGIVSNNDQLAQSIARLTAELIGLNEENLTTYFEPLLNYLVNLPARVSGTAIKPFVEVFSNNFPRESSRIRLIYTITNRLSASEYEVFAADGAVAAQEFVASLLAVLVQTVVSFNEPEFVELATAVLEQKKGTINNEVDARIIRSWGRLAPSLSPTKYPTLLQQLVKAEMTQDPIIISAVKDARVYMARNSGSHTHTLFSHLLDLVIMNDGAARSPNVRNLIVPVAISAERKASMDADTHPAATGEELEYPWHWLNKQRNAWFNLAALGYTSESFTGDELHYLRKFARHSPPLVSEESANHIESDLKINAVLCRGGNEEGMQAQRSVLNKRGLRLNPSAAQYSVDVLFLGATLMVEELCSHSGIISRLPHYFADAELGKNGEGHANMKRITQTMLKEYIRHWGYVKQHTLSTLAQNLKELIVLACHRVDAVRAEAVAMVSQIVHDIPSALCQSTSLFALFDCLTLLGESTTNAAEDEYSPRAVFYSPGSNIRLELSDNAHIRLACRREFEQNITEWLNVVNYALSTDLRSRLYSYLNKNSALGRGRRRALEFLSTDDASDDFVAHCVLLSRYESNMALTNLAGRSQSPDTGEIVQRLREARTSQELETAYAIAGPYISDCQKERSGKITPLSVIRESISAPFRIFTEDAITSGITFWYHILNHHSNLRSFLVSEVIQHSILSARCQRGLFSRKHDPKQPMWAEMEYAPTNKKALDREESIMRRQLGPHERLLTGFLRGCMYNSVLISPVFLPMFAQLSEEWLRAFVGGKVSLHSLARNLRLEVLLFSIEILRFLRSTKNQAQRPYNSYCAIKIERLIVRAGLSWYIQPAPQWSYGSNLLSQQRTFTLMYQFARYLNNQLSSSASPKASSLAAEERLLHQLLTQEHQKLAAWYEPLGPGSVDQRVVRAQAVLSKINGGALDTEDVLTAWGVHPHLAASLNENWRLRAPAVSEEIQYLVNQNPLAVCDYPSAIHVYLAAHFDDTNSRIGILSRSRNNESKLNGRVSYAVLYWHQLSPIESINLLLPPYCDDNTIVQFALRSLQTHEISKTFFYVPQIVQQLRYDTKGYVEEYILEAAKYSQKFAHQIIWNMKANMYMDDDASIESPLKPKLDAVLKRTVASFDEKEREYYETEFKFFGEITAISGKLKPFIKKSKAEKKEKIDEEIQKIEVPKGVYLPSHPDGVVLDIDRSSGQPLQSHAKAPFLAKFKIQTEVEEIDENNGLETEKKTEVVTLGAIFKVGDDCRQDVLALQLISVFRSIFNFCGLDVYVFPNKVTATEAGRGVIDVLPKSTSRDMLGREAVNGLDQWYRSKHGGPNSIEFQKARLNFVKSMAAYSVISYLIQFKDRHNGNIMYDDEGHVIHIDFGFCFDIVPGGVKFEAAPFKLTKEMANLMGGNNSLPYRWFEELCVRAFLVSRVYVDEICRVVAPMLASGLPCFKPQTMRNLRARFALNKTEAEAAKHMRSLIKKSYESNFTKVYDEFQKVTNGIPY